VGEVSTHPVTGEKILIQNTQQAVALFAQFLQTPQAVDLLQAAKIELEGKNLACWCKVGQPCHGDVLLHVASGDRYRKSAA